MRNNAKPLVKCQACGLTQLFNKCQQRLIANVMFLRAGDTLSLLLFEDKLKQLYTMYNSQVGEETTKNLETLDDESIIGILVNR